MNRAKLEALTSAAVTFFGVLLIVAFAIGVSSQGALKGPDAFVLRWTVISLMVAFSALRPRQPSQGWGPPSGDRQRVHLRRLLDH
jgi:hypothetical protein